MEKRGRGPQKTVHHQVPRARLQQTKTQTISHVEALDQLTFGVDVEGPFNADENIIGRAELDRAAPGKASTFRFNNPPDVWQ